MHWEPIGPALRRRLQGGVWAPDLVKHEGRYFIYFPVFRIGAVTNMVVWADDIRGPWSEPVDLKVGGIDPGHIADEAGNRWLFLNAGNLVALSADGLSVTGPVRKVYDGWRYPDEWVVECFAQEGPKMMRRGEYYYMVLAEGGTAGPATSHMVVMARSRSIVGPWENSPYNPVVRTSSEAERWWSRGHATLVEGPDGRWYFVYHAYERGFQNLGRHTLLEPVEWTDDGWVRAVGGDASGVMEIPRGGEAVSHGLDLSDDFKTDAIGVRWLFHAPAMDAAPRHRYTADGLVLKGLGTSPADASPLVMVAMHHAYELETEFTLEGAADAGLLLYYDERLFLGLGYSQTDVKRHSFGRTWSFPLKEAERGRRVSLRLRNDRHLVTLWRKREGAEWERIDLRQEVSGYQHNVGGGFRSLKPAIYVSGAGEATFHRFEYRVLG